MDAATWAMHNKLVHMLAMRLGAAHLRDICMAMAELVSRKLNHAALPSVMLGRLAAHDARHHLEYLAYPFSTCREDH